MEKHEIEDGDLWVEITGKIFQVIHKSSPTWPDMAYVRYAGKQPCWVNPKTIGPWLAYKIN